MTPWLRVLRTTGAGVGLCGAVLVYGTAASPSGPGPSVLSHGSGSSYRLVSYDGQAAPGVPAAPSPSASESERAGSRAGEGRKRPGRVAESATGDRDTEAGDGREDDSALRQGRRDPDASAEPEHSAVAPPGSRPGAGHASGPVVRLLPLGSGLVLIGLGLGLAFVGLRVRRGLS